MGRWFFPLVIWTFSLLMAQRAFAIVLMPGDAGLPADSRPDDAVVGQWGHNATAVAIDPNYILTVAHSGGGASTIVRFGPNSYRVAFAIPVGLADLRVCRITHLDGQDANLAHSTGIYRATDELNQTVVIGGFGQGRGDSFLDNTGRGYEWDGSSNTILRWGCNRIAMVVENRRQQDYLNSLAIAFFDAPSYGGHIEHEAGIAKFDSGCGWFLHTQSGWKLAALGVGTERNGRSACSPPDAMAAMRLSQYADRIERICQGSTGPIKPSRSQAMIAAFNPTLPWLSGWGALTFICVGVVATRRRRRGF